MAAEYAKKLDDLAFLVSPGRDIDNPFLTGVKEGRVNGTYVCAVPLGREEELLFSGEAAAVASLFGDQPKGRGGVAESTIAEFLDTSVQNVRAQVREISRALTLAGARIELSAKDERYHVIPADIASSGVKNASFPHLSEEDAFRGVGNRNSIVIVDRQQLSATDAAAADRARVSDLLTHIHGAAGRKRGKRGGSRPPGRRR